MIAQSLGVSRSTLYYRSRKDDVDLRNEIRRLAFRYKKAGYRMILSTLLRNGWSVNHKKVYRIYSEEGLKIRTKLKKKRFGKPLQPIPVPELPDHTWAGDFVHTVLQKGRKVRIFVVVDLCTREIPILYADYSISGEVLVRRLELLNEIRDIPENFVFDNGPEFRSRSMSDWAEKVGLKLCFIEPGKPTQNAFVESLNGKLRNEFLNNYWFYSLAELREALVDWRLNYNTDRPHSSLGYVPPSEFRRTMLEKLQGTNI